MLFIRKISSAVSTNTYSLDLELSSSQYASIADGSQTGLDVASDFTLECWAKFESLPGSGANYDLISKFNNVANGRAYLFDVRNNAGTYNMRLGLSNDGASTEVLTSNAITVSTGTWYHLAVAWDASASTAYFYQDTVAKGTPTGAMTSVFNSNSDFIVGARLISSSPAEFFDGKIDEVRVWNDLRTSGEISANYNTELTGAEANLQGYWKFNNDYTDSTANGNTLTPGNAPVFSVDVPF